jgi:AcrR family transcriptional regulator
VAPRGDQTREHLLDVAEQLFGRIGVSNVSMRQIRLAAHQGNAAAVQYHFGDRDGIVNAISERHQPKMLALQTALVASIDEDSTGRFDRLVEALVRPFATYITLGPSERAWIKILAELLSNPRLTFDTIAKHSDDQSVSIGTEIYNELATRMPGDLAAERIWAVSQATIHICANRAKIRDDPESTRPMTPDDAFAQNLVDMALGALTAPVTPVVADNAGSVTSTGG